MIIEEKIRRISFNVFCLKLIKKLTSIQYFLEEFCLMYCEFNTKNDYKMTISIKNYEKYFIFIMILYNQNLNDSLFFFS